MGVFLLPWSCTVCFQLFTVCSRCWPIVHHFGRDQRAAWLIEWREKEFLFKCFLCTFCVCLPWYTYIFFTTLWGSMHQKTISQTVPHSRRTALHTKCYIMFLCRTLNKAVKLKWHFHREVFSFFRHALSKGIKVNSLNLFFCWTFPCTCDRIAERPSGWDWDCTVQPCTQIKPPLTLSELSLSLTLSAWHLKADFSWNPWSVPYIQLTLEAVAALDPRAEWMWLLLLSSLICPGKGGHSSSHGNCGQSCWSGNNGPTTWPLPEPPLMQQHGFTPHQQGILLLLRPLWYGYRLPCR